MSVVQETTGTGAFASLQCVEHSVINTRRGLLKRSEVEADAPPSVTRTEATGFLVYNTPGLALSGGGVRSAAVCLGVLQAINESPGFEKIDYLSTVSGGGYIGAALTASMARTGDFVFGSPNDYSDTWSVGHLRNYSNYLLPRGERLSFAKGIAVVLRGLGANAALVLVVALGFALLTIRAYPSRMMLVQGSFLLRLFHLSSWPMALSLALAIVVFLYLVGWAAWRSRRPGRSNDVSGPGVTIASCLLILLAIVVFLDIQPLLIAGLFVLNGPTGGVAATVAWLKNAVEALAPFAGVAAFFGNRLSAYLNSTRQSKNTRTLLARLGAQATIWFAAIILPMMLWLVVLYVCAAGIADNGGDYPFSGGLFDDGGFWLLGFHVPVLWVYCGLFVAMLAVTLAFSPNANSLHRLYRDRLSKAFLFYPPPGATDGTVLPLDDFRLTEMSPATGGPYHLINAALNIQASTLANRRGRNADFFLFSSQFVGSDTTGYVPADQMEKADPELNLATAVAISGAAVSSDMGSRSVRVLAPTLALLNLRLGYWMRNPHWLGKKPKWTTRLRDMTKFYLLLEMFGMLDETESNVYVTDGGHIENLGIYQLLKRGCRSIIAVDVDADPAMEFDSFVTLQRYARIDLGITIDLPWQEIAATSLAVTEAAENNEPIPAKSGPHCALGVIHYPNGVEGYLLYIKSSLSGDENDYILDYKRRNPTFPHEATSDQFFTEEQFEVYRALGFHITQGFFSGEHEFSWTPRDNLKSQQDMLNDFVDSL
jgi:hypothetical protein